MALKELIATPGEAAAGKIMGLFRYSGEARRQLYEAIRAEVDAAVFKEREACAKVADDAEDGRLRDVRDWDGNESDPNASEGWQYAADEAALIATAIRGRNLD
jgi:hypothetical protein